jgi:hypothetical protein
MFYLTVHMAMLHVNVNVKSHTILVVYIELLYTVSL